MEIQDQAGLSSLTINRRLAAVSSLFMELNLLDPVAFPQNPVIPVQRDQTKRKRSQSLYRKQPDRLPDVIAEEDLQAFFAVLPSLSGPHINPAHVDQLLENTRGDFDLFR